MRSPNLFIVGAARSGTSSIWNYLKNHPDVYMPKDELNKEPTYFAECGRKLNLKEYLEIFSSANHKHKWVGEASVAYLTDPKSSKKIYDFNPKSKIIILLRKPWERAYSLYSWMVQDGYEFIPSFEDALRAESDRKLIPKSNWFKPNYYWGYLYFNSGLYCTQIKRYIDQFKDNVLILNFEQLIQNPSQIYTEICSFLGISPVNSGSDIHNPSMGILSAKVVFLLRKLNSFIIQKNRKGKNIKKIIPSLKRRYQQMEKRLARAVEVNDQDKTLGRSVLENIIDYLNDLDEDFPYKHIQSKAQRDHILSFGKKSGSPPSMERETKINLKKAYLSETKELFKMTGIEFSEE